MLFKETMFEKNGAKIRRREYIKLSPSGYTFDKRYKYHKFESHNKALAVVLALRNKFKEDGFRFGIEPFDELRYALIP